MELTPLEKALQLYSNFYLAIPSYDNEGKIEHESAKQCALIAVNEILNNLEDLCISHLGTYQNPKIHYYKEVKKEIEKL